MSLIQYLIGVGIILSTAIGMIIWSILLAVKITWRCGMCGKFNETGIVKFLLCMCDHMGDY